MRKHNIIMGNVYWRGEGVIEYKRETYIWFSIAKANGSEKATERLHKLNWHDYLTTAEIKSAKREAAQRLVATVNY